MSSLPAQKVSATPHAPPKADVYGVPLSQMASAIRAESRKMSGTSGINRGLGNTENRTLTSSYNITLFKEGYETELQPNFPIFTNRPASISSAKTDVICALSVPQINYYLEKGVRQRGSQRSINGRKQLTFDDQFYAYTPEEFAQTYSFIGSLDEKPELPQSYSEGGVIKPALNPKIGVQSTGVVVMKQQFARSVDSGDQLYWLVKSMESPYRCYYNTKGQSIAGKTSSSKTFLQIMGFSDKDTVIPVPNTSKNVDEPGLKDTLGIAKEIATKQHYSILEWDDEAEIFVKRQTEDLDVPDLVVEMYEQGHVMPIGHVQTVRKDVRISEEELLIAHRNWKKLMLLPNVSVVMT